jgi:hypothetical protein
MVKSFPAKELFPALPVVVAILFHWIFEFFVGRVRVRLVGVVSSWALPKPPYII